MCHASLKRSLGGFSLDPGIRYAVGDADMERCRASLADGAVTPSLTGGEDSKAWRRDVDMGVMSCTPGTYCTLRSTVPTVLSMATCVLLAVLHYALIAPCRFSCAQCCAYRTVLLCMCRFADAVSPGKRRRCGRDSLPGSVRWSFKRG